MVFSIITAVYNNRSEIESAIASVNSQRDVKIEHIIQDGGSKDGTIEFIQSLKLPNVKFESGKDKGIYDALNKGISKATGDIVGILHSDDLFHTDVALKKVEELFAAGADGVYADLDYVQKNDVSKIFRRWKSGVFSKLDLELGWMPPHPTLFLRKSVYDEVGGFDLGFKIAADYDFMLRVLSSRKYKISYLPEIIVKMRVGGESNKSVKNIIRKSREDYSIAKKHFKCPSFTVFYKNFRKIHQLFNR